MLKIVTIGGGNGQSNLLDGLSGIISNDIELSSIVSMSDDGRTTGELMRKFQEELGIQLPPPGDLRRCLFSISGSKYKSEFIYILEYIIEFDGDISDFNICSLINKIGISDELFSYLGKFDSNFLSYGLPLNSGIKGHKFGNILMGCLYYNMGQDYSKMIKFMHDLLEVKGKIIPVTTKTAYIKAILGNGEIVETQDRISNVADYSSGIADLELMECSLGANRNKDVDDAISLADYIIIGPGDLFTSIISNFIIGGVQESISKSNAKIIYIGNLTNKGGETMGLTQLDFVNKIERFLGRRIDFFVSNNENPNLSSNDLLKFKNEVSVKGGDYLFLSNGEKKELTRRKIKFIETSLISSHSFYKHSKTILLRVVKEIISL